MKSRAIRKVDVGEFLKRADIKGITVFDVVVGERGEVICVKGFTGHPMIRLEVEKALKSWKFKPATAGGIPIAYIGRIEFNLCNIDCGEDGPSMTITK